MGLAVPPVLTDCNCTPHLHSSLVFWQRTQAGLDLELTSCILTRHGADNKRRLAGLTIAQAGGWQQGSPEPQKQSAWLCTLGSPERRLW